MSQKKINIATQEAFGEAVNSGNLDAFDDLVAANSVDHDPAPGQVSGPKGYREMFAGLRAAFSDFHIEVEHLTATKTDVAFAYTITGTNDGPFEGHRPPARRSRCAACRLDASRTARWWSVGAAVTSLAS